MLEIISLFNMILRSQARFPDIGKKKTCIVIYVKEKKIRFAVSLTRHVIQSAYVSSGFRGVVRGILLFPFHRRPLLLIYKRRTSAKQFPRLFSPSRKHFKVTASGSSNSAYFH